MKGKLSFVGPSGARLSVVFLCAILLFVFLPDIVHGSELQDLTDRINEEWLSSRSSNSRMSFSALGVEALSGTLSNISEDTVLTKENNPYILTGEVTVSPGVTLTVEPGVVIAAYNPFGTAQFLVYGNLIMEGTSAENVRTGGVNRFIDEYPDLPNYPDAAWGIIVRGSGSVSTQHLELRDFWMYSYDSSVIDMRDVDITESGSLGFWDGSTAHLENILFHDNVGLVAAGESTTVSIIDSEIVRHQGEYGIFVSGPASTLTMSSVSIDYAGTVTPDSLVRIEAGAHATINNLVLQGSGDGRGLFVNEADVSATDSIISDFATGVHMEGSSYTTTPSSLTISNSVIKNNSDYSIYLVGDGTEKTADARNNFWGDASGPLHLTENSSGEAAPVSDGVLFDPWLAEEPVFGGEPEEPPYEYIEEDTVWTAAGNPHMIEGTLEVLEDVTLTVEEGVEVRFGMESELIVNGGNLTVNGQEDSPVVFTSDSDDPHARDYYGVSVRNGLVDISHADFSFADVALNTSGSQIVLDNVSFADNGTGIRIFGLDNSISIANSTFSQNDNGIIHENPIPQGRRLMERIFALLSQTAYAEDFILTVSQSSFKDNSLYAILNEPEFGEAGIIQAVNNYWNDPSGPTHDSNSDGTGDKVSDNVLFDPWLTSEPTDEPVGCTENCNSNVMFLPGVMGSRLFEESDVCGFGNDENERWVSKFDCDHERLALNSDGKSVNPLYTKEVDGVIDDAYNFNIYQSFMNDLADWKNDENLIEDYALIPYDWRLSLSDILENGATTTDGKITYDNLQGFENSYIYKKLKELAQTSRTGKVTIVAHSNGGLVAKALIQKLKDADDPLYDLIDNLILVAVPQSGTPDAINVLLHGDNIGKGFIMKTARMRDMASNMPGAYQLLPSSAYWNGEGASIETPVVTFELGAKTQSFINEYGYSINDETTLKSFLLGEDGRTATLYDDLNNPSILNAGLLADAENTHESLDVAWTPSASTTIYQIAGWGEPTLATINYRTIRKCLSIEEVPLSGNMVNRCLLWTDHLTFDPQEIIDGDGVVVTPSALAMSTSSLNVKRLWVDLEDYNGLLDPRISREHRDITEVPDVIDFVKTTISTTSPKTYDFIKNSQPPSDSTERLSFVLHSPLDLIIRDSNGNEVSSSTENISGGRYSRYGEVQVISVPKVSNPIVFLQGTASGSFDLDISELDGDIVVATTTFASIPSATSTTASISFTDGTIENASSLLIDYQGDGEIDETLEPEIGEIVMLPPLVPEDITAPEAIIGFSSTTNSIIITGKDDVTDNPTVSSFATSSVISDEAGNNLQITRTFKKGKNYERIALNKLTYSTTTVMSVGTNSIAQYLWLKNPKNNKYLVFVSHLRTPMEGLIALYDPLKNKTNIISISKDLTDIDLESVIKKLPKGAIIKKTVNGLVIPHLETEKGKIFIKY